MTKKRKGWDFWFACLLLVICIALCGWFAAEELLDKSTDIRIVLTWGAEPADLDLELTGTVPGTGEPFTLNYKQKELQGYASKDLDDVSSFGPETIAITQKFDAPVICTVNDYINRYDAQSTALSESGAKVDVIKDGAVIATYTVEAGQTATSWTVFQLMPNGKIEPINTYEAPDVSAPDSPAPTPVVANPAEFAEGEINVVLTWGAKPEDLDLMLLGTVPGTEEAFRVFWQNSKLAGYAQMIVDDTLSFGPEIINISQLLDAPARFVVSDYTNRNNSQSTALSDSDAKVEVYKGSELIATFEPQPCQVAHVWNVFQLMPDGSIEALNTYETNAQ